MNRILLLQEHKENRRLLSESLATRYQVLSPDLDLGLQILQQSFDLCIIDARALDQHWESVQSRKQAEQPVFLPFLAVTSRQDVGMETRHLWQSIDDLITRPIQKVELQARVEILLRSRQYCLQLRAANTELQTQTAERQRVEAELAKSEAKFRALVQNSSDVIQVVAVDGTVVYASPSIQTILGFSSEEIEGKNAFDFVHPDDLSTAIAPFRASLANLDQTQMSEFRFRHKDGSWRYLESKSNFSNIEQNLSGIVVNSRDITKRKQAEAEILNALNKERELHELKIRFVSMVSHELRNPLSSILAAAQILERYGEKWSKQKKQEFFQRIQAGVITMTQLVDDVLVIGRAEENKFEVNPTYLNLEKFSRDLIQEIQLSTNSKHTITFISQGQCDHAYLDEKLLRHILINLLSNAIKYSPQDSTVTFNLTCQKEEVIFQIKDRGIGIPPEDLGRLFESFHRAANVKNIPGTGLGLTIVRRCVDLQKGKITVTSEVEGGTTFTVILPSIGSQKLEVRSAKPL